MLETVPAETRKKTSLFTLRINVRKHLQGYFPKRETFFLRSESSSSSLMFNRFFSSLALVETIFIRVILPYIITVLRPRHTHTHILQKKQIIASLEHRKKSIALDGKRREGKNTLRMFEK